MKKPEKPLKGDASYDKVLSNLARNQEEERLYRNMWGNDQKLTEDEDFLRKYILQKNWIDTSEDKYRLCKKAQMVDEKDDEISEEVEQFE